MGADIGFFGADHLVFTMHFKSNKAIKVVWEMIWKMSCDNRIMEYTDMI